MAEMKPGRRAGQRRPRTAGGRGDLVAALESGHLAGAVMDVTEQEPLPPEQRLGACPSDHHAARRRAGAPGGIDKITDLFCRNLAAGSRAGR